MPWADGPSDVLLNGHFNSWGRSEPKVRCKRQGDMFVAAIPRQCYPKPGAPPALFVFKFVVGSAWEVSPEHDVGNDGHTDNNFVTLKGEWR